MANGNDNDKIVNEQLDKLDKAADNAGEHKEAFKKEIADFRSEYNSLKDANQKRAMAASLPGIVKGTLSAITAFQQSPPDQIGGCAAVMDILASVSAAIGPEGAIVGAFFSMISMILNFFAPKPPSLLDQIEKLLRNLKADDWKQKLTAVGNGVHNWAVSCELYMAPAKPTDPDHAQSHGGIKTPDLLKKETDKVNLVEGNAALTIWTAQEWLKDANNQELDAWPAILNLHCEVYMRLRLAATQAYLYAFNSEIYSKYIDKSNDGWSDRQAKWYDLQTSAEIKYNNLVLSDINTSDFLNQISPVARQRGLHIFHWAYGGRSWGDVKLASGPKAFEGGGNVQTLRGSALKVSITPPVGGVNDAEAQYDVWIIDDLKNATRQTLNLETRKLRTQQDVLGPANDGASPFADLWPYPIDANKFQVFVAINTSRWSQSGGQLQLYEWNSAASSFNKQSWQPGAASMMPQVRVATLSAPLPDDPDKDGMPDNLIGTPILYAKVDDSDKIFAWVLGYSQQYWVQTPWGSYGGISVDPHFLWMYGDAGMVCTSHASVMKQITNKTKIPYWIASGNGLGSVLDVATCEDGTILALAPGDQAKTSTYHVDFTKDEDFALVIDKWETIPGGGGAQCYKLPIFGWSRAQSLAVLLDQQSTVSTASSNRLRPPT